MADLIDLIDDLLPQTQCEQCGYPGCRPYAEAIAAGAGHNHCPPGGMALQHKLAELLDRDDLPLDIPAASQPGVRLEAVIREDECIGCTKCIQACPVDAIVGARQLMHTVISDACTGCELCVAPCPVDCIDIMRRPEHLQELTLATSRLARERFTARNRRLARKAQEKQQARAQKAAARSAARAPMAISASPETPFNQLQAEYQKTRNQCRQLQAAVDHLKRQGRTPAPAHLAQLQQFTTNVECLKKQLQDMMDAAKKSLSQNGQDLGQLKLAATRSELAWRRAQSITTEVDKLDLLKKQRDSDRVALVHAMQLAGISDQAIGEAPSE